jgi:hypothetical protein
MRPEGFPVNGTNQAEIIIRVIREHPRHWLQGITGRLGFYGIYYFTDCFYDPVKGFTGKIVRMGAVPLLSS